MSSSGGHLEVSRVLLDHGASVDARNQNYWTPIHLSTISGHLEMVKLLVERDADVHGEGQTPYKLSLRTRSREIADLLHGHGEGKLGERFDQILL